MSVFHKCSGCSFAKWTAKWTTFKSLKPQVLSRKSKKVQINFRLKLKRFDNFSNLSKLIQYYASPCGDSPFLARSVAL